MGGNNATQCRAAGPHERAAAAQMIDSYRVAIVGLANCRHGATRSWLSACAASAGQEPSTPIPLDLTA